MTIEPCPLADSEVWSRYLDGELEEARRAEWDRHLLECPACMASVRSLQAVVRATRRVAGVVPPGEVWSGIASRLEAPHPTRRPLPARGWLAAAAILLAIGLTFLFRQPTATTTRWAYAADPVATSAVREALTTLDQAIQESEAALARRPDDSFIRRSLEIARTDRAELLDRTNQLLGRVQ